MRTRDSFAIFIGAVLAAGVTLAAGGTAPTSDKQATPGTAAAASTTHPSGTATEMKHMHLTKAQIVAMQSALAKTGDYTGKVDGILGKETRAALHRYQHASQLQVTGWPDEPTLTKLGVQFTSRAPEPTSNRTSPTPR